MSSSERWGKFKLGAINVVTQPHSAEAYIRLFREAATGGIASKFWGKRAGVLGDVAQTKWLVGERKIDVVEGEIHLWTEFDAAKDWFDKKRKSGLSARSIASNIKFLEDTKPEHVSVKFAFVVPQHVFIFETRRISPRLMSKLLEELLGTAAKLARQELFLTVFQQKEALDRILQMPVINELRIMLRPPNPDDGEEMEREVLERLRKQNANSEEIVLKSDGGLKPSADTQAEARLATRNGRVLAKGLVGPAGAQKKDTLDTNDHPMTHEVAVPPNEQHSKAFGRGVLEFLKRLFSK